MVFSSYIFLFGFLPAVLGLYYLPNGLGLRGRWRERWRTGVLLAASYFFYGWWDPRFCLLLLFSTAVDYVCGLVISGRLGGGFGSPERARKLAVAASVCVNLGLLGWFKYAAFVADNLNRAAEALWIEPLLPLIRIALPAGISFYTFQSMSYAVDLYRGEARPARNFFEFACFVALFPQLVAGPIVRYRELAGQLRARRHGADLFAEGAARFIIGLGKKVLVANPCGAIADTVFDGGGLSMGAAWFGVAAYAFQIYFDFSGYSDMALGLGRMFGFQFPENFRSPYRAEGFSDFWRRWHITLSSFLRDYLYIPLGGNRRGPARTALNLFLVMALGGLWHGAQWTFVLWGLLHGFYLALERLPAASSLGAALPRPARIGLTFLAVCLGWVLFRAANLEEAGRVYLALAGLGEGDPSGWLEADLFRPFNLAVMALAAGLVWLAPRAADIAARPPGLVQAALLFVLFGLSVMALLSQGANPFLYFQF